MEKKNKSVSAIITNKTNLAWNRGDTGKLFRFSSDGEKEEEAIFSVKSVKRCAAPKDNILSSPIPKFSFFSLFV
jgi:hypothetical protein